MSTGLVLAATIILPLVGGIAIGLLPQSAEKSARAVAIAFSGIVLALVTALWLRFDAGSTALQHEVNLPWISGLGMNFHIGVDGIALAMLFLTALLTTLACIASKNVADMPRRYFTLILLLEAGLIGVFAALDLVLFFVFWEVVLIPMFFLISVWGGPNRQYAAVKFFVYTLAGSMAMLAGMIMLYLATGAQTFDMVAMQASAAALPPRLQTGIFLAFAFALAIKVPIVPFHTWLPDAHVEAPTAVSVLLAGVLLKMGTFGFLRFGPQLLPDGFGAVRPAIAVLGVISIVYGAAIALRQSDLKKLVAYSSVSHMGYVMLGIAAGTEAAIMGASVQMFSHGLIAGMAFLLVGALYERTHTREIAEYGGIVKVAPVLGGTMVLMAFASLGLPGMSGFIGEFMVITGSLGAFTWQASLAGAAVVLTAGYLLWMLRRVVFGGLNPRRADLADMTVTEMWAIFPLAAATIAVGVFPQVLAGLMQSAVAAMAALIG